MNLDVTGCDTGRQASDQFEWYIIERPRSGLSPLAHRATRFGPFTTEDECGAFLDGVKQMRQFSNSIFELRKRRRRPDKRHKVEYPVRLCRSGADHTLQLARSIDVSISGARLGSLKSKLKLGEVVTLHCADRKAPFQVVWVGSGSNRRPGRCGVPGSRGKHLETGLIRTN